MITADKARELAEASIDKEMEDIYQAIELQAKRGLRFLRAGIDYTGNTWLWVNCGISKSPQWMLASQHLERNGFTVGFTSWAPSDGPAIHHPPSIDLHTLITW